jgi:hypothetical protein
LASTASAVVALVAIAATISTVQSAVHFRGSPTEARAAAVEAPTVRAVAAAVAAAARELVGGEQVHAALPHRLISLGAPDQADPDAPLHHDEPIVRSRMIAERLLDLPPPGC